MEKREFPLTITEMYRHITNTMFVPGRKTVDGQNYLLQSLTNEGFKLSADERFDGYQFVVTYKHEGLLDSELKFETSLRSNSNDPCCAPITNAEPLVPEHKKP